MFAQKNDRTKKCTLCLEYKVYAEYSPSTSGRCGLMTSCKTCRAVKAKAYRRASIGTELRRYWPGLSTEEVEQRYNELRINQADCCAVCGVSESALKRKLHVDHSHTTGLVRGLLCSNCNTGIGLLQDSQTILLKAISYLGGR